jgi:DnaK suppressor protein
LALLGRYRRRMSRAPGDALQAELVAARRNVADLRQELAAVAESTALGPDDEHDAEGSTVGFERARVSALLTWAEGRVAELVGAAHRLAAGTYRCCQLCHEDIGLERLEALPAARVCVRCAQKASAAADC